MEDGQVMLYSVCFSHSTVLLNSALRKTIHLILRYLFIFLIEQNSVNASYPKIPYPWLVFNEKVKVNSVFLRDSTGVSDSVLLLFGGNVSRGGLVRVLF